MHTYQSNYVAFAAAKHMFVSGWGNSLDFPGLFWKSVDYASLGFNH